MKLLVLLSSMHLMIVSNFTFSQLNSDDPSFYQPINTQNQHNSINSTPKSVIVGVYTIDGEELLCDSTETTLTVSGGCYYNWFADSLETTLIGSNSDLTISSIINDTTVYFASSSVASEAAFTLPVQTTTFSGNVRGYYFQAPSDMYVTGVYVPTDASSGAQSATIVRFNSGPPPTFSVTTNDFTVLGLWQNSVLDTIPVCFTIHAGDYIGVLGSRAGVCSYAPGPYATTINGSSVDLIRIGMQFPLATTAPQELWTEPASSISRVQLIYGGALVSDSIVPVNIVVPQPYLLSTSVDFCTGDSVLVNGNYYSSSTFLSDTLQTVAGCDSIVSIDIIEMSIDLSISQNGIVLTANESGATYQWIDCATGLALANETNVSFTPTMNGNYAVIVTTNGCSDTSSCVLINSVGIESINLEFGLSVFPNPTNSELSYTFKGEESLNYSILDLNGKSVLKGVMTNNSGKIDVSKLVLGTYLLEVSNSEQKTIIRLVKD